VKLIIEMMKTEDIGAVFLMPITYIALVMTVLNLVY
jgi:hypothetical protein